MAGRQPAAGTGLQALCGLSILWAVPALEGSACEVWALGGVPSRRCLGSGTDGDPQHPEVAKGRPELKVEWGWHYRIGAETGVKGP